MASVNNHGQGNGHTGNPPDITTVTATIMIMITATTMTIMHPVTVAGR